MAQNEVYKYADWVSVPVEDAATPTVSGTKGVSGAPIRVGGLNGIIQVGNGDGSNAAGWVSISLVGAWHFTVTGALDFGQEVYITSAGVLTATATDNDLFGYSLSEKGAGSARAIVRLAN
jgi:hypothetical protein